ncbi:hypothetical protein ACFCW6_04770 [Streptomyces sp. NPDC056333]|uniref:hypothetical protein n=1 Tax=Streptomyces sp. NPDC056333 TaxID=3345786 RepID=UPI0035E3A1DA
MERADCCGLHVKVVGQGGQRRTLRGACTRATLARWTCRDAAEANRNEAGLAAISVKT